MYELTNKSLCVGTYIFFMINGNNLSIYYFYARFWNYNKKKYKLLLLCLLNLINDIFGILLTDESIYMDIGNKTIGLNNVNWYEN